MVYCATLPLPETRQVLPSRRLVPRGQHLLGEVDAAVAGGLGPDQRAAPVEALAGEHAGELVAERLYCPKRKPISRPPTPMSPAGTSVLGPMWRKSSVMKLWQKRMTSLSLLPLGSKSRAALAAAHGQRGQGVLEHLLEGQELEDAEVHRGVEAQPALVGADGAVHLDPEAAVDLDLALVVHPGDAEHDHALGLDDALEDLRRAGTPGGGRAPEPATPTTSWTAWWNSGSAGFLALTSAISEVTYSFICLSVIGGGPDGDEEPDRPSDRPSSRPRGRRPRPPDPGGVGDQQP